MRPRSLGFPVLLLVFGSLSPAAWGQEAPAAEPEAPAPKPAPAEPAEPPGQPERHETPSAVRLGTSDMSYSSPRQRAGDNLLMPDGDVEIGGELAFMTADESLGAMEVKFTDVALFRLRARRSIQRKVEMMAGVTLLPKQPSFTDESVWQSASIGIRRAVGKRWALNAGGVGGMLLGNDGWWWSANGGVQTKRRMHETLTFDLSLSAGYVRLEPDGPDESPWLVEVGGAGDVLLHTPRNEVGMWVGASFSVPVVHADVTGMDPQPRLDFRIGLVYALIEKWDLFVEFQVIDRGDLGYPATLLPILDGGFDQRQLVFGLIRRFTKEPSSRGTVWLAM